jgi:uncharacterized delta-60 repeat protein
MKKVCIIVISMLCSIAFANAQSASFDFSFQNNGIQKFNFAQGYSGATNVMQTNNGSYLVAGGVNYGLHSFFAITKYTNDGRIDSSYGKYGRIENLDDTIAYVGQLPVMSLMDVNQKIIIGATTKFPNNNRHIVLHRYDYNGILDSTFGNNGIFYFKYPLATSTDVNRIHLLPDNSFLICGYTNNTNGFTVKVKSNGSVDSTYGTNGVLSYTTSNAGYCIGVENLLSGKTIEVRQYGYFTSVYRILPTGKIDSSFATNGRYVFSDSLNASCTAMMSNGDICIAGVNGVAAKTRITMLDTNAVLNAAFGTNGICTTNFTVLPANVFVLQSNNILISDIYSMDFIKVKTNGTIDATFGVNGKKSLLTNRLTQCRQGMVDAVGKIVVASLFTDVSKRFNTFCVSRVDTNVVFDNSFNNIGYNATIAGRDYNGLNSIGVLSNKKIMALGYQRNTMKVYVSDPNANPFLTMLNANGSINTSFGIDGQKLDTTFYSNIEYMVVDKQDNVIVSSYYADTIVLTKYNASGNLVSTFGINGVSKIKPTFRASFSQLTHNLAVDAQGNIYKCYDSFLNRRIHIAKFTPTGALDNSFGTNGISKDMERIIGHRLYCKEMKLQADGKIVIVGNADSSNIQKVFVARFNTNGSVDSSFNSIGILIINKGIDSIRGNGITIMPNGKIAVCGNNIKNKKPNNAMVAVINANGIIDNSFGTNGILLADALQSEDIAWGIEALQGNKLIVLGDALLTNNQQHQFAILINADGSFNPQFGTNGKFVYSLGGQQVAYFQNAILQDDNTVLISGSSLDAQGVNEMFVAKLLFNAAVGIIDHAATQPSLLFYPNPIHEQATFEYEIKNDAEVSVLIVDMQGRVMQTVANNEYKNAGKHNVKISMSTNTAAGEYYLVFSTKDTKSVIKILKND